MNHYIDIKLKPDAEMRENVLMNKIYTKLHKRLFDLKSTDIGVSFPKYQLKLGLILRIHSSRESLLLLGNKWLGGLSGYCDVQGPIPIPENVSFRTVSRKQSNMTQAKLNRLIKRDTISAEDVKVYKGKMFSQSLDNPFLELESASNGLLHRRFIELGNLMDTPVSGSFDIFGLSKTATIPCF